MRKIEERYYFAYGSNMNLGQMRFRCPDAEVVGNVRLEDYRLAFRGRAPGNGVATVLPEKGSCVDGVLWRITEACEKNLDFYEGFPNFYGKETIQVKDQAGALREVFVYTMNSPHKDVPARPSKFYLDGILEGCLEMIADKGSDGCSKTHQTGNEKSRKAIYKINVTAEGEPSAVFY